MLPKTAEELKQAFSTLLDIPNVEIEKVEDEKKSIGGWHYNVVFCIVRRNALCDSTCN